jgi:hypothetical protein
MVGLAIPHSANVSVGYPRNYGRRMTHRSPRHHARLGTSNHSWVRPRYFIAINGRGSGLREPVDGFGRNVQQLGKLVPITAREVKELFGRADRKLVFKYLYHLCFKPLDVPQSMTRLVTERLQLGMPLCVRFPAPAIAVPGNGHDDRIEPRVRRVRRWGNLCPSPSVQWPGRCAAYDNAGCRRGGHSSTAR